MALYLGDFKKNGPPVRMDGATAATFAVGNDSRLLTSLEYQLRWAGPQGPLGSGTLLLVEDTAYFTFLGRVTTAFTPAYVNVFVTTVGAGAQTAEIGLFSTPAAPNAAGQTLTKIVATDTISDLTATGVKHNSSAFVVSVAAGTYLWGGIRTAMASTEPTCQALNRDFGRGNVLTTATAGALTSGTTFTGAVVAATAATSESPVMFLSMDAI